MSTPVPPLDDLHALLPDTVRRVVERETPIPTIAERAKALAAAHPELVRADIGQIAGVDASIEVLYGPPVGLEPLRAALAETWSRVFGGSGEISSPIGARNVTVCSGAAEGLSLLFRCFGSGRVVGLPRGHWENYLNGVDLAGGRSVIVEFFDARGALDAEGLARRIREEKIAALVANFPCNPTGAVLDHEEAARLAAVARDTGVVIIADEVYARLRYDGVAPVSLVAHAPGHAVAIGSASKEYLLPGARVGYVVSARAQLTDIVLRRLVRANTASPNVLGQQRLLDLLQRDLVDLRAGRDAALLGRVRDEMRRRRDALVTVLARHGMEPVGRAHRKPEGTIFLMASVPAWFRGSDEDFAKTALERCIVSVIPGAAFGLPGAVRLSYGTMTPPDCERLDTNLTRLQASIVTEPSPAAS
ncbi:MAG: pyridoxal phosphate-dependent aminotransferase [Deltaproteobacteria bacterium]|nr:pyridoxal phosphate-dependent aminotransferase [Deltaproteobacteria bacterium]